MKLTVRLFLLAVSGALLAGCATPPGSETAKPKPVAPPMETSPKALPVEPANVAAPPVAAAVEPSISEKTLVTALASFDRGEYALAMKLLKPLTTDLALDTPDRLRAIKSLAFAQCLTRAVLACRKTFETAFQLDPDFDLASAEQGHPVWGPQFLQARQNMKRK